MRDPSGDQDGKQYAPSCSVRRSGSASPLTDDAPQVDDEVEVPGLVACGGERDALAVRRPGEPVGLVGTVGQDPRQRGAVGVHDHHTARAVSHPTFSVEAREQAGDLARRHVLGLSVLAWSSVDLGVRVSSHERQLGAVRGPREVARHPMARSRWSPALRRGRPERGISVRYRSCR